MEDRGNVGRGAKAVVSLFEIEIRPERLSYYLERLQAVTAHSVMEHGLERCEIFSDPRHPNKITILDVFEDSAAYEAHLKQGYLQTFQDEVADCAASAPAHRLLRLVERGKNTTKVLRPIV